MHTIEFGASIESLVCDFLVNQGLTCVQRNYRCRLGEIDLIMFDDQSASLIFTEVRYRAESHFGDGTLSVDWKKQRKLKRAVLHYMQLFSNAQQAARIDVVAVSKHNQKLLDNQVRAAVLVSDGTVSEHCVNGLQLVWTRNAIET